jgi:hypothetical protein
MYASAFETGIYRTRSFNNRRSRTEGIKNRSLLRAAHTGKFEVLITVDRHIEEQQNISVLPLAIIVLHSNSNRLESLLPLIPKALNVLQNIKIGEVRRVSQAEI